MLSLRLAWCLLSLLIVPCFSLLEESFIGFTPANGSVALSQAPILFDPNDFTGVQIAASNLASDFDAVLGKAPEIVRYASAVAPSNGTSRAVIVGSITNSSVIQSLISDKKIDVAEIEGTWETFMTFVVQDPLPSVKEALVVAGSDKRGTIFGIYTLSEQAGQSP